MWTCKSLKYSGCFINIIFHPWTLVVCQSHHFHLSVIEVKVAAHKPPGLQKHLLDRVDAGFYWSNRYRGGDCFFIGKIQGWVIRRRHIIRRIVFITYLTVFFRDGSYGLLRRPISINTPLIRHTQHTRIKRKRIFAILGSTLGLHQPPPNHHQIAPPASRTL